MKVKRTFLTVSYLLAGLTLFSQEVKELKEIESGTEFWDIYEKTLPLIKTDTNAAILILEEAFNNTDNSFTKSSLMRQLGGLYIASKQIDRYLNRCENLIDSGISVFFQIRGNTYPGYTKALENNEHFISLLERSNELVDKANENSTAEYFVQKPIPYDKNTAYPVMIIFHGGIGNIQDNQHFWDSDKLKEEYIVAFVQGRKFICTSKRRFGNEGVADVKNIYQKLKNDYLIDTTKIILGGPSAGTFRMILLEESCLLEMMWLWQQAKEFFD